LKPSQASAILLRTALIFLPMVLTALPIASAQQPNKLAPGSSLSISAKNVGSATSTSYHWATSWGSYDRDYFTQQDVELEAHNLSSLPAKIVVDFYFVGQHTPKSAEKNRDRLSRMSTAIYYLPSFACPRLPTTVREQIMW
jgi:hypothetical protein